MISWWLALSWLLCEQVSYKSYWMRCILELMYNHKGQLSIKEISERTAIRTDDIVRVLEALSLIKYWKGDHIISVTQRLIEDHLRRWAAAPPWIAPAWW